MAGGTPLFPDLGKHCSEEFCHQLDFLPFLCDGCNKFFCPEHRSYSNHHCPNANLHDRVVHICPTCSSSVFQVLNEDASVTLRRHAQSGNCNPKNTSNAAKKCPVKRCKEMLTFGNSVVCKSCGLKTCLKHRFPLEHNCRSGNISDRVVHISPTCSSSVLQVLNDDASLTLRRHAQSGNCNPKNTSKTQSCPVKRCKEIFNLVNSSVCKSCGLETCLKHRFPWDHSCRGSHGTNDNSNAKPNDKTSDRDEAQSCPVKRCKEIFNFVNSCVCKSCGLETCLKHRFPLDHACRGSHGMNDNSNDRTSHRDRSRNE